MTWRYWALKSRDGGLKFEPVMIGGVQLTAEHSYRDPTGSKDSEMLMVWSHSDAERAAAVVDGVYTLDVEQLDHLQFWCAAAQRCTHARAHALTPSVRSVQQAMKRVPARAGGSDGDAAPRGA